MSYRTKKNSTRRQGFTLIELMMTISLIVILVSILAISLNSARTFAMVADTTSRLSTLKMATIQFKDDIGYLPAVLDLNRDLANKPVFPNFNTGGSQTQYRYLNQAWHSITSPAEFFLGYGDRYEDGFGRLSTDPDDDVDPEDLEDSMDEMPRFGIRHPSLDGVWRATDIYATCNVDSHSHTGLGLITDRVPSIRGKLYGPYLEVDDDQMFGRIAFDGEEPIRDPITGQIKVFFPGDPGYDLNQPMVIVDSWGSPIRYYRSVYPSPTDPDAPETGISAAFPQNALYDRPTLSDYFVLRPFEFLTDNVIDGSLSDYMNGEIDPTGDTSTTFELQVGQFAYFSPGPDAQSNDYIRADVFGLTGNSDSEAVGREEPTDEVNADNIVEIGP